MVEITTKIFGQIAVEDDKIIHFDIGILGFPTLQDFTLIYDIDKGNEAAIKWLQSLQEPAFAMPVMNPELVVAGYNPKFQQELLAPLGDNLNSDNILMFVTVTIPKNDITKTTVNLKAPIIVSIDNRKAVQLINDDEAYSVKYAIYDILQARKKEGE